MTTTRSKIETKNTARNRIKCAEIFQIIDDELLYACVLCAAEFSSAVQFENHFLNQHYFDETIMQENSLNTVQPNYEMLSIEIVESPPLLNDTSANENKTPCQDFSTIECELCKEMFYCNSFRDEHNRRVHNSIENPYKCAQCLATFGSNNKYENHLKIHDLQPNVLTCMYCQQVFDKTSDLDRHLVGSSISDKKADIFSVPKIVASTDMFQCSNWDETQESITKIKLIDQNVIEMIKIKYDLCDDFKEYDNNARISHTISHHSCLLCKVQFAKHEDLDKHRKTIHSIGKIAIEPIKRSAPVDLPQSSGRPASKNRSKKQPMQCDEPVIQSSSPSKVEASQSEHISDQQTCTICNKHFRGAANLKRHLMVHSGEKPHLCSLCGLRFNRRSRLNEHIQRTHNLVKPYKCALCPKEFSTKHYLQAHIDWHNQKKVSCTVCGKSFFGECYLKKHKEAVHNPAAARKAKGTAVKRQHRTMIRQPKGPKAMRNYPCHVCSSIFPDKLLMYRHVKSVHADYKRYACKLCDKVFSKPYYLLGHMDRHTNTMHKCQFCDKSYFGQIYLDRHYAAVHKDKEIEEECAADLLLIEIID